MIRLLKRRCLVIVFCIYICSSIFAGCSKQTNTIKGASKKDTITITDCIGRKVAVPTKIERAACLFSTSADIVTMLGKGDNIVAVSSGQKRSKLLLDICPNIKDALTPKGGGNFNIEELIRSKPDVVFFYTDVIKDRTVKKKLDDLGIPYIIIDYKNIEQQKNVVKMIGKIMGNESEAEKYIKYYDECIERVSKVISKVPQEKRERVYHAINEVSRTDSPNTLPAEWTKIAGAKNVSIEEKPEGVLADSFKMMNTKLFVSFEQICLWDPDAIIINGESVEVYIRAKEQFKKLKALKNDKVYLLPNGITPWGHPYSIETPLAILWTANTLYPEEFKDINMVEETKKFYKEFFEYDLSDELVKQILSGKGLRKPKKDI